jgi:hypothetical protein
LSGAKVVPDRRVISICLITWAPDVTHYRGRCMLVALAQRLDLLGGGLGRPLRFAGLLGGRPSHPLRLTDLLSEGLGQMGHSW